MADTRARFEHPVLVTIYDPLGILRGERDFVEERFDANKAKRFLESIGWKVEIRELEPEHENA